MLYKCKQCVFLAQCVTHCRYDKETSTLICDELQVAYPIVNGIPNLIPEDAKKLHIEDDIEKNTP